MTINTSTDEIRGNTAAAVTGLAQSGSLAESGPAAPSDAIQLTRLGGVLNAFQASAAESSAHMSGLGAAVRNQVYSIDGLALGKKIVSEMLNG